MTAFRTLNDLHFANKTVLVRADLNVPMHNGVVTDTTRIDRLVPTLKEIAAKGAKVVILSHFGRPKGKAVPEFSLQQILPDLEKALGTTVTFGSDCIGPHAKLAIEKTAQGGFALLENVRFHAGEEKNDPDFAQALADLGDIYIDDAFSAAHRAHASTEGLARLLPNAAGRQMEAELKALAEALEHPQRPVVAVVGGAKISTKLELLGNLVRQVDALILGGGMANTFLHAHGKPVGVSLCEKDMADQVMAIMDRAVQAGCTIILPVDAAVAHEFKAGASCEMLAIEAVPSDGMMLDIGPDTIAHLSQTLDSARTVVWNGPLGAFEIEPFDRGTTAIARHVAALTEAGRVLSVAGGGDTVSALTHAGVVDSFSYVSTAGGAFLEWLEGKELPGVSALRQKA